MHFLSSSSSHISKWLATSHYTTLPSIVYNTYRFALQLLTPASILSQLQGRTEIELEDVRETDTLFLDARSSARQLSGAGANGSATVGRGEYMR